MPDEVSEKRKHPPRSHVWVECKPVGDLHGLQSSSGGDSYGLSLVVDVVAGALAFFWRLIVGRGRWRVVVTERGTNRVLFSEVYKSKRAAKQDGMRHVDHLFGPSPGA